MRGLGKIRRSASRFATFVAGMMLSAGAFAGEFYLGGSVGNANVDVQAQTGADVSDVLLSDLGLSGTVTLSSDSLDDTDVGYKIFAGYAFDNYWAIEAKYGDFGTVSEVAVASVNVTDGIDTLVGTVTLGADLDLTGYGVDFVGSYPVSDTFSVFAKIGYFFYNADGTLNLGFTGTDNGVASTFSDSGSEDDDGSDFSFGLGGDYRFNNMAIRLEWERYRINVFDTDFDTDLISASFIYKF